MLMLSVFLLTATAGTALTLCACPCLSLWWALPLWLGYYVVAVLLYVIWLFSAILLSPKTDNPTPRMRCLYRWIETHTLSWLLPQLGIRRKVTGLDKIPTDSAYLLVCNHRSAFDPITTLSAIKKGDMCFVGKPEVFKVPVLGAAMQRVGFFPIDRENPRNAVTAIKHGAELISQQNRSVCIYPEGTRCKTPEMLPFHAGSFKIAKLANCPVVVASIRYEKRKVLPGIKRIHLHVVDVMDVDFVKESNTNALADRAQEAIKKDLNL